MKLPKVTLVKTYTAKNARSISFFMSNLPTKNIINALVSRIKCLVVSLKNSKHHLFKLSKVDRMYLIKCQWKNSIRYSNKTAIQLTR